VLRSLALLFGVAIGLPLAAATVIVEGSAAQLEGAEVCRFRAREAENPFRRWLHSQEVMCVPAARSVDFPAGLWNVFARGNGVVSGAPLLIDGDAAPASIHIATGPAATVTALLPDGHAGIVYAPRRATAFPVEGNRVAVLADEPLWLLVLERSTPVAIVSIPPLAAGTERGVDARKGAAPSLIGWLRVPEAQRKALATTTGVTPPAVRAGSRDAEAVPPLPLLHGAFFRIRDVTTGNAELRLEGRGWLPDVRVVNVRPGVTVAPAPLVARATGTLVVHWNAEEDLPALDRSVGACTEDAPKLVISISKCPSLRSGPRGESEECTPVSEQVGTDFRGSVTFDAIAPGAYRAEMRYGKLPPVGGVASVSPMGISELRLFASYYTVHGSVTRGGEPLGEDVRIQFPGGSGFAAADTEEYRAVFRPPGLGVDAQITVAACDGAPRAIVLAEQPMRPHTRFNIDIPANQLTIQVTDTFTTERLGGAMVKLEALSIRGTLQTVYATTATTNDEGKVVWPGIPPRELRITVRHAGYEERVLEPFSLTARETRTVDAQLVPLRGTRGKIVSDRPFAEAAVVWYSPTGTLTERADLAPDGSFSCANWHTPEETMAVVSASHPLWVLRAPASERRQSLSLAFPGAGTAAFDVWLASAAPAAESRYIGIAIGGVRVPQPALAEHLTLRRLAPLLRGSGPHPIRDLLATGPIEVLRGPRVEDVDGRWRGIDLFALTQFADAPRTRLVPGTTDVVLEGER
jgi:hypothetical protein